MGTNTQQGDFSRSGSASATDPVFGLTDSLSAEVHQSVTVTSLPLGDLILLTFANFETPSGDLGGGAFSRTSFWSLSLDDDIAATFTLTTESLVTLGGAATPGFSPELLNSAGIPVYVFPTSGDFSTTPVSLGAGTYQLIYDFSGGVGGFGFNNSNTTQINVLSALVQAEVPEPRWPWAVLVLLVGLISFAHRRRRVLL